MPELVAWTDARTAELVELRDRGMSAAAIASELGGVSRSAVLGKLSRLGRGAIAGKPFTSRSDETPKAKAEAADKARARRRAAREAAKPAEPAPPARAPAKSEAAAFDADRLDAALPLADLEAHQCRFAVTADSVAPADHRFCALPVADREAGLVDPRRRYCRHHVRRVVDPRRGEARR